MAYFSYRTSTGDLIQISDYEIQMTEDDMTVSQSPLSKEALEKEYIWHRDMLDFCPKSKLQKITKLEFLRRFTAEERIAVRERAKSDPIVFDAMELLNLAESIEINDPDTQNLVKYLALIQIIDPARVPEILR